MKNNKIKFFRYYGNKHFCIDKINKIINSSKKNNYAELCGGSLSIFLNLEKKFDNYIINEIDKNIHKIYNAVKFCSYDSYTSLYNEIFKKFGNIKNDKQAYYAFREWYNKNFYNSINPLKSIFEGIPLYFLFNSCINSFPRFGKDGFNQSFGGRLYFFDENTFNLIKEKIKNCNLTCKDYEEYSDLQDNLIFFDPPYSYNKCKTYYKDEAINTFEKHVIFIEKLLNNNNDIIYTNVYNKNILKNFNCKIIRQMKNTSPHRSSENTDKEACWYYINN